MTSRGGRLLVRLAVGVGVAYLVGIVGIAALQDRLIYFPEKQGPEPPSDPQLLFRNVDFVASDGVKLHGWFFSAAHPRASLLHAHGNAGHIGHRLFLVRPLLDSGVSVFLFDYRGYGRSDGTPSEQGLYRDAEAAATELRKQPETAGLPVLYYGESLGGAVATELAVRRPPSALVLQSTFTSMPDMAAAAFPWLPARWLVRAQYRSIDKVARFSSFPVLVIHGQRDSVIPFVMGERLFAAIPGTRKHFLAIPQADHNDVWDHAEASIVRAIGDLLTDAKETP
jgi:uncharacterized protein